MWISPSQCSFPGNKWGAEFQNLLVAIKMCVYVGRGCSFYKFSLKKSRTAKLSKIPDLHKIEGLREWNWLFTHQHLTHTKISFLLKQHQGILQSEFSFLAIENGICYCLLFSGKVPRIGFSISSCLCETDKGSRSPWGGILALVQFSPRRVLMGPLFLPVSDWLGLDQFACHIFLFKWWLTKDLSWSFN